ncbi:hypothetical protein SVIOM342S_09754 [Streptomyces violaceorubidus]
MLGQSKTAQQAEIDSPCELVDFWRFNVHYAGTSSPSSPRPTPRACGTAWTTARWRGFVRMGTPHVIPWDERYVPLCLAASISQ